MPLRRAASLVAPFVEAVDESLDFGGCVTNKPTPRRAFFLSWTQARTCNACCTTTTTFAPRIGPPGLTGDPRFDALLKAVADFALN